MDEVCNPVRESEITVMKGDMNARVGCNVGESDAMDRWQIRG